MKQVLNRSFSIVSYSIMIMMMMMMIMIPIFQNSFKPLGYRWYR